jgi:hypothetical protein
LTREKPEAVRLLAGGNPQIPKADGDAPVEAYIRAMPGWKSALGRRLDQLIVETVPGVQKAVRWNSPFYRVEGSGYFASFHCFTRYVKLTFFDGMSLEPVPPGGTEHVGSIFTNMTSWMRICCAAGSGRRRPCLGGYPEPGKGLVPILGKLRSDGLCRPCGGRFPVRRLCPVKRFAQDCVKGMPGGERYQQPVKW